MKIETYDKKYDKEVIALILEIQNNEAKINLSIDEQPDIKDIHKNYQLSGGEFWIAEENNHVIGTIGIIIKENQCAVMKKFFIASKYRSKGIGLKLYQKLIEFAKKNIKHIILDTPSTAVKSHRFYEKSGFKKINRNQLPIEYTYPDRNSLLYMLDII